jgi:hypothetical protein
MAKGSGFKESEGDGSEEHAAKAKTGRKAV